MRRRDWENLLVRVTKLESQAAQVKWWHVASGIAAILGAILALFTLISILNHLASFS